ncbi:MAG: class I SAM-dependent methyltransferase, partial [Acidobacteria bacterium]|nr:class I SAM-dependent methyltransferase [Acidobacteriota bacterium]
IKAHSDLRFRSEYDYALFEYYRSAKVIAFLERGGVNIRGWVLDAGCGGGGMPLSLAEEARRVVGIDLVDRFRGAGVRLARERRLSNLFFSRANGLALPFRDRTFDLVLSHAVIEHVPDATQYLRECARVLKPSGRMYLSTAPYLSFAGAHLPRLRVPVPLHLLLGRRAAFAVFRTLARHAAWTLREPANENSFIKAARRNEQKADDLLEKVRVATLRRQIRAAGLQPLHEALHVTGTVRKLPRPVANWLRDSSLMQDIVVGNLEYVLARAGAAPDAGSIAATTTARHG